VVSDFSVTAWDGTDDLLVKWEDVDAIAPDYWGYQRRPEGPRTVRRGRSRRCARRPLQRS